MTEVLVLMIPVIGLVRLAGQIWPSVHMGSFLTIYMGNFCSGTEMNKAQPFKFHPGSRA